MKLVIVRAQTILGEEMGKVTGRFHSKDFNMFICSMISPFLMLTCNLDLKAVTGRCRKAGANASVISLRISWRHTVPRHHRQYAG